MLSLYNSLGLDGGSVSKGNKLLAIGNDVRGMSKAIFQAIRELTLIRMV